MAFVASVSDCLGKSGCGQAAGAAELFALRLAVFTLAYWGEISQLQAFSAAGAKIPGLRSGRHSTKITDWHTGETQERAAAKGTRGRKQRAGEAIRRTSQHADYGPPYRSLWRRDVGSQGYRLTREDAPLAGRRG